MGAWVLRLKGGFGRDTPKVAGSCLVQGCVGLAVGQARRDRIVAFALHKHSRCDGGGGDGARRRRRQICRAGVARKRAPLFNPFHVGTLTKPVGSRRKGIHTNGRRVGG